MIKTLVLIFLFSAYSIAQQRVTFGFMKSLRGIEGIMSEVLPGARNQMNVLEIKMMDNGDGIPEAIREKIFQPFFTTMPTGQVTGLVLSLAYDIVKAHGGELKVESKDGEGTEFIISIPVLSFLT